MDWRGSVPERERVCRRARGWRQSPGPYEAPTKQGPGRRERIQAAKLTPQANTRRCGAFLRLSPGDGAQHSLIVSVASAKTDSMRGKQETTTGRDTMMRMQNIVLLIIDAALLGKTQVSSAQSPYSYP